MSSINTETLYLCKLYKHLTYIHRVYIAVKKKNN